MLNASCTVVTFGVVANHVTTHLLKPLLLLQVDSRGNRSNAQTFKL